MVQNHKKLSSYGRAIRAGRLPVAQGLIRSADDELHGAVIHDLMRNFSVSIPDVERRFGVHFSDTFADDLRLLEALGDEGLVMTRPVITVEPSTDLSRCASTMVCRHLSALPVVEGGRAVGVLTQRDILDYYAHLV